MAERRRYTKEQEQAVVADVAELGVRGAAAKHGIPQANVSRWKRALDATEAAHIARARTPVARPGPKTSAEPAPAPEAGKRVPRAKTAAPAGAPPAEETPAQPEPAVAGVAGMSALAGPRPEARAAVPQRRVAKLYTPSQKAQMLEFAAQHGVTKTAEHFDTSRFSIYDWRRRVEKAANGEGASPTSGPDPTDIEAKRDREILDEWHHHPGLGPSQIRNQLRRKKVKVSVHTVRRVMEDAGYRPPKVVRQNHDDRYESVRPNHMWHCDYVQRYINHTPTFTLIFIDDYSRYVVGYGVDDAERADMVIATFEEAVQRHGKPEFLMNDGGSAFWSWRGISRFTSLLTEMGVDQITAKTKELNGKSEVFNANLEKEFFEVHRFHDVTAMRRGLGGHLHWYNHGRTHHALGGLLVPADRYYGRADEVLARIEVGGGREKSLDTLDLRDRSLDLFKVISKDGVPEVWLFGKKLV
jgi:transposase InsO family protein